METYDAVVAGGGPAGSAAAIALARAGRRVLLADRPRAAGARTQARAQTQALKIGETLPGAATTILRELGLLAAFERAGVAIASTGTCTAWGGGPALSADAILDPLGPGWHLDRVGFDTWLREQARVAGSEVCRACVRAQPVDGGSDPACADDTPRWRVALGDPAGREVACRRLVDATGRGASIARQRGAARERSDRLVAVYARVRTAADDVDARTRVASHPGGWCYSAPVGAGRRVVALLTDADLLDPALRTASGFAAALATAGAHVVAGAAITPDAVETGVHATAAHSARLSPPCGEDWLAIGDAAIAFDPLSSQGILNALVSGRLGAGAVDASLSGASEALVEYGDRLADVWASYASRLREAYALEARWPQAPFWARRVAAPAPAATRAMPSTAR